MNNSLYAFLGLALTIIAGGVWFFRATIRDLQKLAAQHARQYAVAYIKGGALVAIAVGAAFDETFKDLTHELAAAMPWWGWATLFWKPIGAGLAVIVAFLDRSAQHATDKNTQASTTQSPPP